MTILTLALLVFLSVQTQTPANVSQSPSSSANQESNDLVVQAELEAAAKAYRLGNFALAEQRSRIALQLDPNNKTACMYVARTVHAQFRPGDTTEENFAKARQAIEEYRNILKLSPKDEEAYKAIAYLFGALKDYEQLREWIRQRATDESFEPEKRAQAYVVLASKSWDCSYRITDQHVITIKVNETPKVTYKMPKDPGDFQRAVTCVAEGLVEVDHAIALEPTNDSAWSYKYNLLLERSKLFAMDGKMDQKAQNDMLADQALKQVMQLQKKKSNP